jgi:hypothetical protein
MKYFINNVWELAGRSTDMVYDHKTIGTGVPLLALTDQKIIIRGKEGPRYSKQAE